MTVLLCILAVLGGQYLLWGARDLLGGLPGDPAPHARYVLNGAGEIGRIIFFALGGHFFALILSHLIDPFEDAITASISEPPLNYPPLISSRKLGFWMVIILSYGLRLCYLLPYLYCFLRPLREGWPADTPPDPALALGGYHAFFIGLALGLYPSILVGILSALFQHLPEDQQQDRRFTRQMFVNVPAGRDPVDIGLLDYRR